MTWVMLDSAKRESRSDIQVLRACAVVLVILSHLPGTLSFDGGYLGVDIFFAVSGYLVIKSWAREIHGGKPSFVSIQFLKKRLARLSPALSFAVILTLLLQVLFIKTDTNSWQFLISGLSGENYLANFFFWFNGSDYWAPMVRHSPYLQLWSLGVELQSYILLSLLLAGSVWHRRNTMPYTFSASFLALVGIFSLVFFIFLNTQGPANADAASTSVSSFYNPFARLWEFLAGCLVAMRASNLNRNLGKWLVLGGSLAILIGLYLGNQGSYTPVTNVLVILGTAAILLRPVAPLGPPNKLVEGALWIGDRSYSIYLLHWPIFVFLFAGSNEVPVWKILIGAALTFLLASFSYKVFEQNSKWLSPKTANFKFSLRLMSLHAGVSVVLLSALLLALSPAVRSPETISANSIALIKSPVSAHGLLEPLKACSRTPSSITCEPNNSSGKSVMVIGDSLALQLFPAVAFVARERGLGAELIWHGGCGIEESSCPAEVYERIRLVRPIKLFTAMNMARASNLRHGGEADSGLRTKCNTSETLSHCKAHNDEVETFLSSSEKGLEYLKSLSPSIVIASPFPQQSEQSEACLNKPLLQSFILPRENSNQCGKTSLDWQLMRQGNFVKAFDSFDSNANSVRVWDPYKSLCRNGMCPAVTQSGERIMNDPIHWTWQASRFFVTALAATMREQTKPASATNSSEEVND